MDELFARMREDFPRVELKVVHAGMVRLEEFVIDGRVDPDYRRLNSDDEDCVSYSIKVVDSTKTIDYDPDGDIKP